MYLVVHLLRHSSFQNDSIKRWTGREHSILHLRAHLRFHFREQLKMHKNVKKKVHCTHQLMPHLAVQSRSAIEDTFYGAPNDSRRDLHKDVQKGACEVVLSSALEVALGLYL